MRELALFKDPRMARHFAAYLQEHGIETSLSPVGNSFQMWLVNPYELEDAEVYLRHFLRNPNHPRYNRAAQRAGISGVAPRPKKVDATEKDVSTEKDVFEWGGDESPSVSQPPLFSGVWFASMGPVTKSVFVITLLVYLSIFFVGDSLYRGLIMPADLADLAYQPWRLITPIFLHFGILHLAFNLLWWMELGRIIERFQSSQQLLFVTLVTATASALAQHLSTGPNFGGLSGVVYGLLGYLWLYGRINPAAGYALRKEIVWFMLGWLVFCYVGLADIVANEAHLMGLISGCLLGSLVGYWRRGHYH